jgi:hypothetical protein
VERNARASILLLPLLLDACIVPLGKLGEDTDTDASTSDGTPSTGSTGGESSSGDASGSSDDTDTDTGPAPSERQVDILFVMDNSGSMGEEQASLSQAIDALVSTLESAPLPVDYRIGVTTTDNGNPWCGATSPEGGTLRATSCRARPTEFVFDGAVVVDAFDEACGSICPEGLDDLAITDGKPWIDVQSSLGTSNVAGGAVGDNLRCMLPQGIDGCGFESPLESAWKSLERMEDASDSAFGFHREGALLAVVVVTDEVDCSSNPTWDEIFLPDGNHVFWSDPSAAAPTSAVCWNAGVACTEIADGLYDCESEDYDVSGALAGSEDEAVLHPVERYTNALLARGAYVAAIYGVNSNGSVTYRDSLEDPQFQEDFGIAPGCESPKGRAVPPVRTREVVTTLGGSQFSICDDDLSPALEAFGEGILVRLP